MLFFCRHRLDEADELGRGLEAGVDHQLHDGAATTASTTGRSSASARPWPASASVEPLRTRFWAVASLVGRRNFLPVTMVRLCYEASARDSAGEMHTITSTSAPLALLIDEWECS